MTRPALLNNVDHRNLRIDTARSAALGDAVMSAPTYPAEFRNVQAHYPIVFRRTPQAFEPVALFGLRQGENVFLDGTRWDATYVPLAIERQPFLIGVGDGGAPMMHIDLDSPRVGGDHGEALFREHGGSTDFLERMQSVLLALHEGLAANAAFVDALQRHELLESCVLDAQLDDGTELRLAGFHAIAEERLRELAPEALVELHRTGHLQPIYMAVASVSRFRDLIDRTNRRHAARR
ncbi:SapC family protein [Coralloluteibacterium stylophorae]|uniref:SapC family protein n=2 Tax=Coralloluteibacterium stylophorae TaxID=1776034 RepID=A0AAP2FYD6_9GAMM|nr:SapC family protein [Coralloluteibacterium stylophorae]MBS7455566.1 SapC family protein [Coralloluteibacterium stylophorae]